MTDANPYNRLLCGHLARWATDNPDGTQHCVACECKELVIQVHRLEAELLERDAEIKRLQRLLETI